MHELVAADCVKHSSELSVEEDENFDGTLFCEIWSDNGVQLYVSQTETDDIVIHQIGYNVMTLKEYLDTVSPEMFRKKTVDKV